jgi:hypothetical protein
MNKTRYNAPDITTGLILKAPDIARIGIPNEHKEMCYYEWLSESTTVSHILNNTDICEEFYKKTVVISETKKRPYPEGPIHCTALFSKKLGKKAVDRADIEKVLVEHAIVENWVFNLQDLVNVAKLLYMRLMT